jgi:hypothetical protein
MKLKSFFLYASYLLCLVLPISSYCQINSTKTQKRSDIKSVSFCNLVNNPEKYIGKKVKMFVTYQSSFAGWTLLSDSQCERTMLFPQISSNGENSEKIKQEIEGKLLEDDGTTQKGTILVVGELKKSLKKLGYPIKGLLQDYYFSIETVGKLEIINK